MGPLANFKAKYRWSEYIRGFERVAKAAAERAKREGEDDQAEFFGGVAFAASMTMVGNRIKGDYTWHPESLRGVAAGYAVIDLATVFWQARGDTPPLVLPPFHPPKDHAE